MHYAWVDMEEAQERKRVWKSLIPKFIVLICKKSSYRRRYPKAFVTASSKIASAAKIGDHCIIRDTAIGNNVSVGRFTTTGPACRFDGKGRIEIGSFCSIAPECLIWSENHNMNSISTYPFEAVLNGRCERFEEYKGAEVTVGHDVWIGQRCTILAGAKIGDGCLIAAGSIVPRGEYPAYSVIGGNPAKVIKSRFDIAIVEKLRARKWWEEPESKLFGEMLDFLHSEHT